MKFFDEIRVATQNEARRLQSTPQIVDALQGRITRQAYIDYLTQAYHHVRHTVPLMQAAKARLDDAHARFRTALDEYIEEETGHEEWILDDIAKAGGNADAVRRSQPNEATELMVAYAYDQVQRGNPMSFFGMVYVLEGTSIQLADMGAKAVQASLGLPPSAFRYLTSHGALDIEHMAFFENLMNEVESPDDRAAIIHMARRMFGLFAGVFASIHNEAGVAHAS
ncbi:MAG: iron-containing redox enzyme family protein [Hyphomonas sp.]|nr:iron-containing redox enzyme family protein [Hyphomonas sp.]